MEKHQRLNMLKQCSEHLQGHAAPPSCFFSRKARAAASSSASSAASALFVRSLISSSMRTIFAANVSFASSTPRVSAMLTAKDESTWNLRLLKQKHKQGSIPNSVVSSKNIKNSFLATLGGLARISSDVMILCHYHPRKTLKEINTSKWRLAPPDWSWHCVILTLNIKFPQAWHANKTRKKRLKNTKRHKKMPFTPSRELCSP